MNELVNKKSQSLPDLGSIIVSKSGQSLSSQKVSQLKVELREANAELQEYRQMLFNAPEAILITDQDFQIVYVNPAWEKLTGYSYQEAIGQNPNLLKTAKTPKEVFQKLKYNLKHNQPFSTEEMVNQRKDGSLFQTYSTFFSILTKSGRILYIQSQHDISERKLIDNLKKQFLSLAAHELKTPITTLKLISQAHIEKYKESGKDQIKLSELKLIDNELERLNQLVNDILDDNRIESGKLFLQLEVLELNKFIRQLIKKIRIIYPKHYLHFQPMPKPTKILIDPHRIEQVLINLISNAAKYSSEYTDIMIGATAEDSKIIVWVQDQGIGIAENLQSQIFDRFFQVKHKEARGFGLGLFITREIIKLHKGKLWVESEVGRGSTFYFSIPRFKD